MLSLPVVSPEIPGSSARRLAIPRRFLLLFPPRHSRLACHAVFFRDEPRVSEEAPVAPASPSIGATPQVLKVIGRHGAEDGAFLGPFGVAIGLDGK